MENEIKLCEVEWLDAQICTGEFCREDVTEAVNKKLPTVKTCGFLVEEAEYLIVVARDWMGSDIFRDLILIPKKFILKKTILKKVV
jgi:hypothetical protein